MKALILTAGSQGDIQPFVALAARLRQAGDEAVLVAPPRFRSIAASRGVAFVPLESFDMTLVAKAMLDVHGPRRFLRLASSMGRLANGTLAGVRSAATGIDIVVHHPLIPLGQHLAESLAVPAVAATPIPAYVPTARFPSPQWAVMTRLPGPINLLSYHATRWAIAAPCRRETDRWRTHQAGLPRRGGRHDPLKDSTGTAIPVLHAFSRHVLPPPHDWPDTAQVTGYWFLPTPRTWEPPHKLARFLTAGPPPVYFGLGSTSLGEPGPLVAAVQQVVTRLGIRALVSRGYRGLAGLEPSQRVLQIGNVPHDWLFPRVRAVVHHGGAGTAGAAAAAGRPQLICPAGVDQPFWGHRMHELGVAPAPLPLRSLTAKGLEHALRQIIEDPGMTERSADLAHAINAEDGIKTAISALHQVLKEGRQ
ncbi:glycosyltransferase [Streptomyces sp. NPDC048527]|uniref:glycosyltransferase n=1 Tax=Streptomyces sp. NPDC048527 TaxID=3365568 RepID=UPI00371A0497